MAWPPFSANHTAPSGPRVTPLGFAGFWYLIGWGCGTGYSVNEPDVVSRPIFSPLVSLNHTAPSEPSAMNAAPELAVGMGYVVTEPEVVTRAIAFSPFSSTHTAPSDPVTSDRAEAPASMENSTMDGAGDAGDTRGVSETVVTRTAVAATAWRFVMTRMTPRLRRGPMCTPRELHTRSTSRHRTS